MTSIRSNHLSLKFKSIEPLGFKGILENLSLWQNKCEISTFSLCNSALLFCFFRDPPASPLPIKKVSGKGLIENAYL